MAFGAFMKIEKIPGECTQKGHEEWIEVLSFHHGLFQPVTSSVSTGGSISGQLAAHNCFSITKSLDAASPKLAQACAAGEPVGTVTLALCRATGAEPQQYMEYVLNGAVVASLQPSGAAQGGEDLPTEEVSFAYMMINWKYTVLDAEGVAQGDVEGMFDRGTGAPA